MIPYGRQNISAEDLLAVENALRSEFLTQGPRVAEFETALAAYVGAKFGIAANSATSALHLACLALGVGKGDLVWTSAISFVASANAARYCGAEVDFVDIEPETFNIDPHALRRKLDHARQTGMTLPKVVIPVHMAGLSANMAEIRELSDEFGFRIIEDASHALGASYLDFRVGSCRFSDITVFSFHPVKMITTGEGGMCLTNSDHLSARIQSFRSHGITRDPSEMVNHYDGGWYYEQQNLGYNYRITDLQCALGLSQLKRIDDFVRERNDIAKKYESLLSDTGLALPEVPKGTLSSFHLYIVRTDDPSGLGRKRLFESLRAQGILVNVHYIPIYRHPYYQRLGLYRAEDFPIAEDYYWRCLSLPIFPGITDEQLGDVAAAISNRLGHQTIF